METLFGIDTPRDWLSELEADFADYAKRPGDRRLALHYAIAAYHLHEKVWSDWLKTNDQARQALGIGKSKDDFIDWICRHCVWFSLIQKLANAAKHPKSLASFEARLVSLRPEARNLLNAGAEDNHWDGPMPYLTAGPDVLLIDHGPEAGETHNRYMPVSHLFEVVLRFWNDFFARYVPALATPSEDTALVS